MTLFLKRILLLLLVCSTLFSCKLRERYNKQFNYFQKGIDSSIAFKNFAEYIFHENDYLSIQVIQGANDQKDASTYNLPTSEVSIRQTLMQQTNISANYVIDSTGFISFPKVGKIKVAGLNKRQIATNIEKLISDDVFKPTVIVKLNQFKVSVLGEVKTVGNIIFKTENVSVLDAIAEAGDLTDYGKRDDIILLRENNGKYEKHIIDLTNPTFISTDLYQLHNNDIIYVNANKVKLKTINYNPNFQRDLGFALTFLNTTIFLITTFGILRR